MLSLEKICDCRFGQVFLVVLAMLVVFLIKQGNEKIVNQIIKFFLAISFLGFSVLPLKLSQMNK